MNWLLSNARKSNYFFQQLSPEEKCCFTEKKIVKVLRKPVTLSFLLISVLQNISQNSIETCIHGILKFYLQRTPLSAAFRFRSVIP